MNHWGLFKQSWSMVWRNGALWVFGLLAALGGGFNFNWNVGQARPMTELPVGLRTLLRDMFSSSAFTTLVVIALGLGIITFVLGTFAQGALISLVNVIAGGETVSVRQGVNAGSRRFAPLLAVRFVLALPLLILGALATGSCFAAFSSVLEPGNEQLFNFGQVGTAFGLGAIVGVLGVLISAIGVGAERAVVLNDMPVWDSIARGWQLLWSRFFDYFTIALLFIVVAIIAGIVFACALIPIVFAAIIPSLAQLQPGVNVFTFVTTVAGPTAVIVVLIGLIIGSFSSAFISSVWTLAYRQWPAPEQPPTPGLAEP